MVMCVYTRSIRDDGDMRCEGCRKRLARQGPNEVMAGWAGLELGGRAVNSRELYQLGY